MLNRELIHPRSIVIVGGSHDISRPGGKIIKNLKEGKFQGEIYAINPKGEDIQGVKCFKDAKDCPPVDLAIFAIPAHLIKPAVLDLVAKGVRGYIILSAGFGEMGEKGKEEEREIIQNISKVKGQLIGPNCIGVLTPFYQGVFTGTIPRMDARAGCDFASGSGATAVFIMEKAMTLGVPFSSIYSVGNSAQIGVEEIVQHWDETFDEKNDPKVKLLYMESVRNPQKLLTHARSLIRKGCRIAAIKAGRSESGQRAASSHTGAMLSSDEAINALFKKAGIIRCEGREELLAMASVLRQKKAKGNNFAIITHAGGPGVMLTDTLTQEGLNVLALSQESQEKILAKLFPGSSAANPIDILATGNINELKHVIETLELEEEHENIHAIIVIFGNAGLFDINPIYNYLREKQQTSKKPLFVIFPSLVTASEAIKEFQNLGGVYFDDEVTFGKLFAKAHFARDPFHHESNQESEELKNEIKKIIASSSNGYLPPEKVKDLLRCAKIPLVEELVVLNSEDGHSFAMKVGFPVVMKVVGPIHKSDVGGVKLSIHDRDSLEKAFVDLMRIKDAKGVLIQKQIQGTQLFIGAKYEKDFGHLLVVGPGGVYVEILNDIQKTLTPVTQEEAYQMILSLKTIKLFKGFRGQKSVSLEKWATIAEKLSILLINSPEIKELDINPLLAEDDNIFAVDARILIQK